MALLYLKDPLPMADLELWVKAESRKCDALGFFFLRALPLTKDKGNAITLFRFWADCISYNRN